ncbi:sugar kinase [Actinoalloteichus hymeniacidonis]|uniref:Sugar kinase, ribokinase n=1 Tax=Actinoalloteichus hymeniacidonis TaxID=340345 RepID=A0AAC9MZU8_9PSEU|nr:sugar kinase [Actinoalloteichus hymeniacidonis]AOS64740.1 sugar kinase, ribokinase [Actinoalloteichus hymeniacidonis]MBB5907184.1 2-dehydro-3-deoxygluconokinase [Actinoalloteichus hymeniacidonis]
MAAAQPSALCVGESMIVLVPEGGGPLEENALFRRSAGGAESNVAGMLACLGVRTSWLSRLGADGFGRHVLAEVAARGVDVSGVELDPVRPTGLYVKELDGSAGVAAPPGQDAVARRRMHYYRSGSAASAMAPELVSSGPPRALLAAADLVHVSGITAALSDSAAELVGALLRRPRDGRPGDGLVSFDLNWRPALWRDRDPSVLAELCDLADVVLVGSDEAETVLGTADPVRLREILPNPTSLVIKNDAHEAAVVDREGRVTAVPALRVEVVDSIGAGDAFAAGYLAAMLRGESAPRSLRLGHLCAALVLTVAEDHGPPPAAAVIETMLNCTDEEWAAAEVSAGAVRLRR